MFFSPARSQKLVMHIAGSLGELIDVDSISKYLTDPEKLKQLTPGIEAHLDQFLEVKLQEKLPVIATFVGPSTLGKIKEAMVEEIDLLLPQVISQYADSLLKNMDMSNMLVEKLQSSSSMDIMIAAALRPQIKLLGLMGAVIGLVAGLLSVLLQSTL